MPRPVKPNIPWKHLPDRGSLTVHHGDPLGQGVSVNSPRSGCDSWSSRSCRCSSAQRNERPTPSPPAPRPAAPAESPSPSLCANSWSSRDRGRPLQIGIISVSAPASPQSWWRVPCPGSAGGLSPKAGAGRELWYPQEFPLLSLPSRCQSGSKMLNLACFPPVKCASFHLSGSSLTSGISSMLLRKESWASFFGIIRSTLSLQEKNRNRRRR